MTLVWLLGVILAGIFQAPTDGVPAEQNLVAREYKYSDQFSEDAHHNLKKRMYINCGPIPAIENGNYVSYGNTVLYTCNHGFRIIGSPQIVCKNYGQWNLPPPRCDPVSCGPVPHVEHSEFTIYGNTVQYICKPPYRLVGAAQLTCGKYNRWHPAPPICKPADCGPEPTIDNGSSRKLGNSVVFSCYLGFRLLGPAKITCMPHGQWNSPPPLCQPVGCGLVPGIENGNFQKINNRVTYTCNSGFILFGSSQIICLTNGHWNGSPPRCRPLIIGAKGEKGNMGITGPKGLKGIPGMRGSQGFPGAQGQRGSKGSQGDPGMPGHQGLKGDTGLQGPQGNPGDQGMKGLPGRKGMQGQIGMPGSKGEVGAVGPSGDRGIPGPPGPPGPDIILPISAFSVKLEKSFPPCGLPILFTKVLYNEQGDYNVETGLFTCRVSGVYYFSLYCEVYSTNAYIEIMVNNRAVIKSFQSYDKHYEMLAAGIIVKLSAGDTVCAMAKDNFNGITAQSILNGLLIIGC